MKKNLETLPNWRSLSAEAESNVNTFICDRSATACGRPVTRRCSRNLTRRPRKRGGVAKRRGIDREHDCLLVARDRTGKTLDFHTGRGQVTAAQLHECLKPVLPADVLLIGDGAVAYRRFAGDAGITLEAVNVQAGIRARGAIHLQKRKQLAQPLQKLAGAVSRCGEPLPDPLLRMAAGAGRPPPDDAGPPVMRGGPARLDGAAA
jgi:hypothetical protein